MEIKKIFFIFLLIIVVTGSVFGQEYKNTIAAELNLIGFGLKYERFLTDWFSLGGRASYATEFKLDYHYLVLWYFPPIAIPIPEVGIIEDYMVWSIDFVASLNAPWKISPFVELGLGIGNHSGFIYHVSKIGFILTPAFGLKLQGRVPVSIGLALPMSWGNQNESVVVESGPGGGWDVFPRLFLGVGFSF